MKLKLPPPLLRRRSRRGHDAFTVLEVCLATALFGYFAIASVFGMVQFNRMASVARYRTLAQVVAQQKMDQIMTTSWSYASTKPAVLNSSTENNLPLNNDTFNTGTLSSIYTSSDSPVTATRTTTITTLSSRLIQATVVLTYNYAGRPYTITLVGIRASDDF